METIVWLFPILFIFHDFEEIIFMSGWVKRNEAKVAKHFPRLAQVMLKTTGSLTTEGFSFAVAVLFVFICLVCEISLLFHSYWIWMSLFSFFFLHLFIHIIQAIVLRSYVPALITSIIAIFPCLFMFCSIIYLFPIWKLILGVVIVLLAFVLLFPLLIRQAQLFDNLQKRFDAGEV